MRGKQGFRQTRNRDVRVVFAGTDASALNIAINTATPSGLNGNNPATIFSGFQNTALTVSSGAANEPALRLGVAGAQFALLPYVADAPGSAPTTSQILISSDAKKWRTRTLPTRVTTDPLKHAWAEVYGNNNRLIVSHKHYPDIAVSENGRDWTLLQDVFAVNGFSSNCVAYAGNNTLVAVADNAQTVYQSTDNGLTWAAIASSIPITENTAVIKTKALDQVVALTRGVDGATPVFFMLAARNDITRYRYVLTSADGISWTQRFRVDLGTAGTPQEPLMASSAGNTVIVLNNLVTASTLITTTSAANWLQLLITPAANWRALQHDGEKFIATGEPRGLSADPLVMTLTTVAQGWAVKLTGTHKLRTAATGPTTQLQPDGSVSLFLNMAGSVGSSTFIDASYAPKNVIATGVTISDTQIKWPNTYSAAFPSPSSNKYLSISGSPDIAVGTGDFTLEAWIWLETYTGGTLWESNPINTWSYRPNGFVWYLASDGTLRVYRSGSDIATTAASIVPLQTWTHVALVRNNDKTTIYVNGQSRATTLTTFNDTAAQGGALIGRFCDNASSLNGYIGELRLTKGVALYTGATLEVPTSPLLNYNPLSKPRGFLAYPANQQIALTWSAPWIPNSTTVTGYNVQYSADNGATWNTFADVAATVTTTTVTGLVNNTNYLLRVAAVNDDGIGPYVTTATPVTPTNGDPLFNSVSLLLRFNETTGTFIDTSPRPKTLTANNGGATFNALSKWGDGSAFFQGGSLTTPSNTDFSFGTGDFTIEFWAYPTANTVAGAMINVGYYYDGILFRQRSGADSLYLNSNWVNWDSQTNMPSNVWTHVALVRESGVVAVYANGTRILTWNNTANLNPSGTFVTIGAGAHSGFSEPFYGYLDELRITKGVARYSGANAPVPIGPFLGASV
jgi:hypothetical protein